MKFGTILNSVERSFIKPENAIKVGAEVFKKDTELLSEIRELKTPELTERIAEHLIKEGRPGSAEYISMFSKSAVLDHELTLVETGTFDTQRLEQQGLVIMVDAEKTTKEMINSGQAVLTTDARTDMIGSANTLTYKLKQHIEKTASKASDYYAAEFTNEEGVGTKIQRMLGIKSEPYEIPFAPNEEELARIKELSERKYHTVEEMQQTFKREIHHIMRQRPGSMGLATTQSAVEFVNDIALELSDNSKAAVSINKLRRLHEHMKGQGMEELQIFPDFGDAIENGIDRN